MDMTKRYGNWALITGASKGMGMALTAMPMRLMQPGQVADIALSALGKKPLVTAGLSNKLSAFLSRRVLSRKRAARLWENIMTRSLAAGKSQKRDNGGMPSA